VGLPKDRRRKEKEGKENKAELKCLVSSTQKGGKRNANLRVGF